jgi:tetratricopeptide (TPR) repeat protein
MKTLLMIVCLGICLAPAVAQKSKKIKEPKLKPDQDAFQVAVDLFEDQQYKAALRAFRQFQVQFPKSKLKASAHYNVAMIFYFDKEYDSAKKVFLEILDQPYNEQDPNDIMEPYKLYKHNTCRMLAEISIEEREYQAAERYITLFDKDYPYQHFCGNEWAAYDMYKAVMLAKVHTGLNRPEKAIQELVPHIFDNGLASNEEVLETLYTILKTTYAADQVREELNKALASVTIRKEDDRETGFMTLYGIEVEIDAWDSEEKPGKTGVDRYKDIVMNSEFFKRYL